MLNAASTFEGRETFTMSPRGGRRRQPASPEAPVAVIDRTAVYIPPENFEASLRQLDQQSSGATSRLEETADPTFSMQKEAAFQEIALEAGTDSKDEVVVLRVVVQCPVKRCYHNHSILRTDRERARVASRPIQSD